MKKLIDAITRNPMLKRAIGMLKTLLATMPDALDIPPEVRLYTMPGLTALG